MRLAKTERTFRERFINLLQKRALKEGLKVFDELTVETLSHNNRLMLKIPDIVIVRKALVIENEGEILAPEKAIVAVVETKHPSKDVHEGTFQAIKYMSLVKCSTCFSTNFKDVIAFKFQHNQSEADEKSFGKKVTHESIKNAADFVFSVTVGSTDLIEVVRNDTVLIKILEGAVREMYEYSERISSEKLEEPLGLFYTKKLDSKITKSPKARKELDLATKRAASYLLINQIVFYHMLSTEAQAYPPLTEISHLGQLQERFDQVLDSNYTPIFGAKVAPLLPAEAIEAVNRIITAIRYLRFDQIRHDILGKIFHGLIPKVLRKRIAAYYTSNSAAELLASLAIENKDELVLDLACGSGTLLVASYHRKKFLMDHAVNEIELHKKLLKEIYGIDVALFAAHLAAIHLALQQPLSYTDEVQITLADTMEINPNSIVYYFGGTEMAKKVSTDKVVEVQYTIPNVDVVIMNPPFTRIHRMQKSYRKFLERAIARRSGYTGGQLGLYGYFVLHADDFLKRNGRIAAVLPASTLYTSSAEGVRDFLLKNYRVEFIITSDAQTTFSEQSDFKEILLVARKVAEFSFESRFVTLKVPLTLLNYERIAKKLKSVTTDYEDHEIRVRIVNKHLLTKHDNWMAYTEPVALSEILRQLESAAGNNIVKGKQVISKQKRRRGFELYGADFFFIPNKTWGIDKEGDIAVSIKNQSTDETITIPRKYLKKALRVPELYWNAISPTIKHYVLTIPPTSMELLPTDLQRYIEWGEQKKFPAVKRGNLWYSFIYKQLSKKNMFGNVTLMRKFLPKTRGVLAHFFDNQTTSAKTYYVISVDREVCKAIAGWFNSTIYLAEFIENRRSVGKASNEIMLEDLDGLPCLNISQLSDNEVSDIGDALDNMRERKLPLIPEQIGESYRRKLDKTILKAMNITQADEILDELYSAISTKLKYM